VLQAALQDAQAAMTRLEAVLVEARSGEASDDRSWLSARAECSRASALLTDLVRAVWTTQCKNLRGEDLVECKEAVFESIVEQSLGKSWQSACSAEDTA
jgi:hypothetical protein